MGFSDEELANCKAAMLKPAPRAALAAIADGRLVIEQTKDFRDILLVEIDGRRVERMFLAGGWPLYRAGMIDEFGVVTDAGRALLTPTKDSSS